MKNEKCLRCQGGETALVVSILVLLVALPAAASLVLWRFTRARALTFVATCLVLMLVNGLLTVCVMPLLSLNRYRIYRRVFDIGRFKVTQSSRTAREI